YAAALCGEFGEAIAAGRRANHRGREGGAISMRRRHAAPHWNIEAWRKATKLDSAKIPAHQITENGLKALLKTMVINTYDDRVSSVAYYFLNHRRGSLKRNGSLDAHWFDDIEQRRVGWCCGDWEHRAIAWKKISARHARTIKLVTEEQKK